MAGYFYPPPPSRIGGNQPYAPKLGIAQSGPSPDAPPLRGPLALATLALVVGAWTPQPVRVQTSANIAPLIPVAVASTQVPYSRLVQDRTIIDAWNQSTLVVLGGNQVAPLLFVPPQIDNPPPSTNTNLNVLIRSWQPIPYLIQGAANIAPLTQAVVANPPYSRAGLSQALSSWTPLQWPAQYRPFIASLPIVNDPPRSSQVNAQTILNSWTPPWYPSQGASGVAPILPQLVVADSPPIPGAVNLQSVIRSWISPWMPAQGFTRIASVLPRVDNAPTRSLINYELIGRQWQPRWTGPDQVKFAPLAPPPPVISPPPLRTYENLNLIVNRWVPPYFHIQGYAHAAPILPAVVPPAAPMHLSLRPQIASILIRQKAIAEISIRFAPADIKLRPT